MKFLFFDTETSGLPDNYKLSYTALNNWPRLIQLAYAVYDDKGNLLEDYETLVRPHGFLISSAAFKVHGITQEKAMQEGKPLLDVLELFDRAVESSHLLVAHNASFDRAVMSAERERYGSGLGGFYWSKPSLCTMKASTQFCKIKGAYGYKWPNLQELHNKLFGVGFEGAHDALTDVKACARCFFELRRQGVINL